MGKKVYKTKTQNLSKNVKIRCVHFKQLSYALECLQPKKRAIYVKNRIVKNISIIFEDFFKRSSHLMTLHFFNTKVL
jgi:hypothetical protein